eukprot:CAMPEP_0195302948 /NCGR_PEP_ID=MMETSP0707-20130614/31965_1 /TAXON_ID=33640 /ORGANISM="Asterionellopsis glacialis, Strain CCMP134" /LENGTH=1157 /DNA_ID=CAMNT_0040366337 /DNA_START=74 /DNA_END=3547 /DNA_ORIENTATION=-
MEKMGMKVLFWMLMLRAVLSNSANNPIGTLFPARLSSLSKPRLLRTKNSSFGRQVLNCRGGGQSNSKGESEITEKAMESDEERYSRQVYTLGARAHGLVRSATIYLDGPTTSGLVFECGKNLALSGVGHIVVLTNGDDEIEETYHNRKLDDLGQAYDRAARAEIGHDNGVKEDPTDVLVEFLQRLNPSVGVTKKSRAVLKAGKKMEGSILLSIDRPYSTQTHLNSLCRKCQMPFVSVETAGVYGKTFCDFGSSFESFDADGETPLVVPLDHVVETENGEGNILVKCIEGEKHDVSKGDKIQFQLSTGEAMSQTYTVQQVQTPQRFTIRLDESDDISDYTVVDTVNAKATSFSRIKVSQTITFLPFGDAMKQSNEDDSLFSACDLDKSWDPIRKRAILCSFEAVEKFIDIHARLPNRNDAKEMIELSETCIAAKSGLVGDPQWRQHVQSFTCACAGKFTPVQALFGAIGAQEALKAASGLYNPIQQFLLYDCDEVLDSVSTATSGDASKCGAAAPGQSYVLGRALTKKLASKRLFMVGAGAIGCELLKNLSAMGAGTGKGCIIVTDMDTIERSNLSRQLLFRDTDIGNFKSKAAQEAVLRFNPKIKVEVHTSKVGVEDHGPFTDEFWSEGMDIILNALDNVEARLYMDSQCVTNRKALIDAGTLGSKGNVQVVVPGKSESYGSSADPPEPAIPVCTLKNFPYAISHTIQWGRDLIEGLFQRRPTQANEYAKSFSSMDAKDFALMLEKKLGTDAAFEAAKELNEDLSIERAESLRDASISWAVMTAKTLFHDSIVDLLQQHPIDSLDDEGDPFWSGTRRVPKILSYSVSDDPQQQKVNENLVEFVRKTARLRIESVRSTDSSISVEEAVTALKGVAWGDEVYEEGMDDIDEEGDTIEKIVKVLNDTILPEEHVQMTAIEFEKDDETNGHVAFVTAASNLRALCYGIAPVDAMETRRVAGKIVPAMITTTAFVSALSCIELLKVIQKAPLQHHRNAFINLALPFFAFTAPLPAEEMQGLHGKTHTLWDRIVLKEGEKAAAKGGLTLRRLLQRVKKKAAADPDSIEISTVSFGPYMIYANFLHEDDDDMLDKPFLQVLKDAISSGDDFDEEFSRDDGEESSTIDLDGLDHRSYLDITVIVEDLENGDEVELPPVRLIKWKQ